MADLVKRAEILKDATPREAAYVAVDARFEDIDTDLVRRVKSVSEAPVAYLPYLAWERSVDVYDPVWPEAIKRAVIAAAPEVHRYKGTRHAVETAMRALSIEAEIVEWWQASPRAAPYTFHVSLFVQPGLYAGVVLDARLIRVAYVAINRAKPLSRAYTMSIYARFPAVIGLAPIAVATAVTRATAHPPHGDALAAGVGLVPVTIAASKTRARAIPAHGDALAARAGLSAAVVGRVRVSALLTASP